MKKKLTLSLAAIAVILLISSIISVMEYRSMSSYISSLIAKDINYINTARQLADISNSYNLEILAVIGDESLVDVPKFDVGNFMDRWDSLKVSLTSKSIQTLADSVAYSFSAYILTSYEMENVVLSDFIDSRAWYFDRLQPRFHRLHSDIDALSTAIYKDLEHNSITFENGFYRSIIPGVVAVGVGLLLVFMLYFFIMSYYVRPLYRILDVLKSYNAIGKKYGLKFEGDDQLVELNDQITELATENEILKKRISAMKNRNLQEK